MNNLIHKVKRRAHPLRISAISDDNLEEWLSFLGVLDSLLAGRLQCHICTSTLSLDNLQYVSRYHGEVVLICQDPACIQEFAFAHPHT